MDTPIIVKNLTKKFGNVIAVNNVSLTIDPRTFLTLLGPSGCGKTTLLRCIAGLEDPNDGEIFVGDKLIYSRKKGVSLPPGQRDLGLVFQNYALWPHMNVYKNMTFALEIQKMSKDEMDKRVKQSLAEVKMSGYEDRYPREMSGGQQQRIALARMLAYSPRVFLMDEPLSNLDARLRMDMRTEIKRLHYVSGATTVYVTHDQVEAMTMSTNIAIMREGVIQQMASPDVIYHFPANLFIADFIGNPKVNLLSGYISGKNVVNVNGLNIPVKTFNHSGDVVLGIRPEDVSVSVEAIPEALEFQAYSVMPSGAETTIIARKGDTEVTIREMGVSNMQMDQPIWLTFHEECTNLYDSVSGNLISK